MSDTYKGNERRAVDVNATTSALVKILNELTEVKMETKYLKEHIVKLETDIEKRIHSSIEHLDEKTFGAVNRMSEAFYEYKKCEEEDFEKYVTVMKLEHSDIMSRIEKNELKIAELEKKISDIEHRPAYSALAGIKRIVWIVVGILTPGLITLIVLGIRASL